MFKRSAVASIASTVIAAALFSQNVAAAGPSAGAFRTESALASWVVDRGDRVVAYVLWVRRLVGVLPAENTKVVVHRGPCEVIHGDYWCTARKKFKKVVSSNAFTVHPLLDEARLEFRMRGATQHASWKATDDRTPAIFPGGDTSGGGVTTWQLRRARTHGRLLGQKLRVADWGRGLLQSWSGAYVKTGIDGALRDTLGPRISIELTGASR
ncbi:MAG: hypothetical protein M3285_06495 [Actinomycetota bacterium]|nr:hypothetical protein [Actinomycetota bacterium]